ncbi:MAG TPA: adenylate kinase [Chloroflexota bacterium]|jgi:adenylate kinase
MNLIVFGPPGAGKGTQAKRLESVLHLPHVASGDIFRDIRKQDSPLAHEVRSYMDAGNYVPDELTIELVLARLRKSDALQGFILDGFPRTEPQAEALDRALAGDHRKLDVALYINVPDDIITQRLQGRIICPQCHAIYNVVTHPPRLDLTCDVCGHALEKRTDETPEVIGTRLVVYEQQTAPLVQYYGTRGILREVDGNRAVREVEVGVDVALDLRGVK